MNSQDGSDADRVAQVFSANEKLLRNTAFRIVKNAADADDITQSALTNVLARGAGTWDEQDIRRVLFAAVRNGAIDLYRRSTRLPHDPIDEVFRDAPPAAAESPDLALALQGFRESLSDTEVEVYDRNVVGGEPLARIAAEKGKESDSWEREIRKRVIGKLREHLPIVVALRNSDDIATHARTVCARIAAADRDSNYDFVLSHDDWYAAAEWVLDHVAADSSLLSNLKLLFHPLWFSAIGPPADHHRDIRLARRARRFAKSVKAANLMVDLYAFEGRSWLTLGHTNRAAAAAIRGIRYARETRDPELVGDAISNGFQYHLLPRDLARAIPLFEERAASLSSQWSIHWLWAVISAHLELENGIAALACMDELRLATSIQGHNWGEGWESGDECRLLLATGDAYAMAGRNVAALRCYREVLERELDNCDQALARIFYVLSWKRAARYRVLADEIQQAMFAVKKVTESVTYDELYYAGSGCLLRGYYPAARDIFATLKNRHEIFPSKVCGHLIGWPEWPTYPSAERVRLAYAFATLRCGEYAEAVQELEQTLRQLDELKHPLRRVARRLLDEARAALAASHRAG